MWGGAFVPLNPTVAKWADKFGRMPRLYRDVFSTDQGLLVLRDLARFCGVLETSVMAGDPHMTAFNEGKRAAFLHIIERLRWNERDILKMAESRTAARADNED